jgi:hypothetical protein
MRWLAALLLAAVICAVAGQAQAAASRVALVRPATASAGIAEATTRVSAELRAAGFEVVLFEARGTDPRAQVAGARLEPPPFAIISLLATDRGAAADVWIDPSLVAGVPSRRVEVDDTSAGTASALAIRAMELLRAALLEETARPRPQPAAVPEDVARWLAAAPGAGPGAAPASRVAPAPSAATARPAPARPSAAGSASAVDGAARWAPLLDTSTLEGGLGWLQSFGGVGAAFGPSLRLTLPVAPRTALRASLLAPAITGEVSASAGAAGLRQELLMVEATRALGDGSLVPMLSAGVGGYHLFAEGRAEAGYSADAVHAWALAIGGGGGAALRLTRAASLLLDARAVVLLPEPVVRIGDTEAARAGAALLLVSLGVVASL